MSVRVVVVLSAWVHAVAMLPWRETPLAPWMGPHGIGLRTTPESVDFAFPVDPARRFFFITHHKTGTNLMWRLCDQVAQLASKGQEVCHWCLRFQPQTGNSKLLSCMDYSSLATGHTVASNFSRFNLISEMGTEFNSFRQTFPNFRAVHMTRDPVDLVISCYLFDKILLTPAGEDSMNSRSDLKVKDLGKAHGIHQGLQRESQATLDVLKNMDALSALAAGEPRVLALDLDAFRVDYNSTAARLFNFLFDGPPQAQVDHFLEEAVWQDKSLWGADYHDPWPGTRSTNVSNRREALAAWKELEEAGDTSILRVNSYIERLGYSLDRHWTGA